MSMDKMNIKLRMTISIIVIVAGFIGQAMAAGVVNDTMCSAYSAVDTDEYW